MEYRKLISFGKSSYVISLPKPWITKHRLKKGDLIYFDEKDNNLLLQPKELERTEEDKEVVINIDGKDVGQMQREIIPAYINNFKTIIIKGKELREKAPEVQRIINSLIALAVMEQTSDTIITKDFLNIKDVSLPSLIRKMDIITRSMFADSLKTFDEDHYSAIYYRDGDTNKLYYLISRLVKYGFKNQLQMNKLFNLTAEDLFTYKWMAHHIEAISDETKRIARYMRLIKLPKTEQVKFVSLYSKIEQNYLDMMKAYYAQDKALALQIASTKTETIKRCDDFYSQNASTQWIAHVINRVKTLVAAIHEVGRVVYQ